MDEAMRMLNDYKGGHSNFLVAQGIVDSFVEEHKTNHPGKLYSPRQSKVEKDDKRKYTKKRVYSETETNFMIWENGSAPAGELRKFTRFGKVRFYEKTETGCIEITKQQYNLKEKYYAEDTYRRAEREISEAADTDGSSERRLPDDPIGNRNTPGTAPLSKQVIGEELRDDPGRGVQSNGRNGGRAGIKESHRTTESLSTRSILTNALEGVAQNEWEQNNLNEYKENIAKVEEMESRLQEINSQLYPYGKKMPQKERIALQDEAVGLRNKITNIDKKLLRLEATKPLQNVLNRERARVRREMKQKADERISEVKAEAAQRLKRRSEGHAATEMRKKIRKTIRELDKILNRGDKKRLDSKPLFIFSFTHRFIEIFYFSQYTVFQR